MPETVTIIDTPKSPYVISEATEGKGYAVFKNGKQVSRAFKFISGAMSEAISLSAKDKASPGFQFESKTWKKWNPKAPPPDLGSL